MNRINAEEFLKFIDKETADLRRCIADSVKRESYGEAELYQEDISMLRMIKCMITGEDDIIPLGDFIESDEEEE